MTWTRIVSSMVVCILSTGCASELMRKIHEEVEYHDAMQDFLIGKRNQKLANSAWEDYGCANSSCDFSKHYACGFKQGFADYLDGGTGEPPIIPPRRYWSVSYQTPDGHQNVEDWFTGYRFGAIAAEQSGYRHWVTIPTSLPHPAANDHERQVTPLKSIPEPTLESVPAPSRRPSSPHDIQPQLGPEPAEAMLLLQAPSSRPAQGNVAHVPGITSRWVASRNTD